MELDSMIGQIIHGDCFDVMKEISDKSIDMVLCDLPYGTTACKWDTCLPLDILWEHYKRIIKDTGIIALCGSQPFSSLLVTSNIQMYKHEWIWIKNRGSNFANTVREPMKEHESILIFANKGGHTTNKCRKEPGAGRQGRIILWSIIAKTVKQQGASKGENTKISKLRVPSSWQKFNVEVGLHPTQKPVKLFEYLIKTYTNEDDLILDNCSGAGTTAIGCLYTKRRFICIEKEEKYVDLSRQRLKDEQAQMELL